MGEGSETKTRPERKRTGDGRIGGRRSYGTRKPDTRAYQVVAAGMVGMEPRVTGGDLVASEAGMWPRERTAKAKASPSMRSEKSERPIVAMKRLETVATRL